MRIQIQDVDQDHVTSQLKEAITKKNPQPKVTEVQSTEPTTSSEKTTPRVPLILDVTEDNFDGNTSEPNSVPNIAEKLSENPILSPADIGRINSKPIKQETPRSKSPRELSPRSEPSLKPPVNSFQFQRDWKSVNTDLDKAYDYLKVS